MFMLSAAVCKVMETMHLTAHEWGIITGNVDAVPNSLLLYQYFGRRRNTKENKSLLLGMWLSQDKGKAEILNVFCAMFFIDKVPLQKEPVWLDGQAEHVGQQYVLPNHRYSSITRILAM